MWTWLIQTRVVLILGSIGFQPVRRCDVASDNETLLPISALQHLLFCERQCALIHIERLWAENRLTTEGRQLHERAHDGPDETRSGLRIARGVKLRSFRLGLWGVADVVEFRPADTSGATTAPFPVEYKRGRPKHHDADRVQLCAQALCLEEMLNVPVPGGALFYGKTRRRESVAFDAALRAFTERTAADVHALIAARVTPTARREKKCDRCSMLNLCLPSATGSRKSVAGYIRHALTSTADASRDVPGSDETP